MATEKQIRAWIAEWTELKESIGLLRAQESALRARIVNECFGELSEGINRAVATGLEIVVHHEVSRKVDETIVDSPKFAANCRAVKLSLDALIRYKPELNLRDYRKLTEQQLRLFDNCLVIKPGSDKLEII